MSHEHLLSSKPLANINPHISLQVVKTKLQTASDLVGLKTMQRYFAKSHVDIAQVLL